MKQVFLTVSIFMIFSSVVIGIMLCKGKDKKAGSIVILIIATILIALFRISNIFTI